MSHPAITVDGISKKYRIGLKERPHQTFREAATSLLSAPFRGLSRATQESRGDGDFFALKDVSFEVQPGEVVGIIGRNGAGKSTLLKLLSRITEPTSGEIRLRGRVASLLEVGTGFHQELTGRENIYLNGSILGMKRAEITRKFDEIVDFSGVEKFLDTPVKYYSSGMYVRLAFAVAAHLEPEILIVDEVLAVGDTEFQKKCLGKMREVSRSKGRTVLFVSHNIAAIRSLCTRAVLLHHGRLTLWDTVPVVVDRYSMPSGVSDEPINSFTRPGMSSPWMRDAAMEHDGKPATTIPMGSELTISVSFGAYPPIRHPKIGFVIAAADGTRIVCANNRYQDGDAFDEKVTEGVIECQLGRVPLMPGTYTVALYLGHDAADTHVVDEALRFEVIERDLWGHGKLPPRGAAYMWCPAAFTLRTQVDSECLS